jgi:hypothetical protein
MSGKSIAFATYLEAAAMAFRDAMRQAKAGGNTPIITGAGMVSPEGLEITVLVLCDDAEKKLGLRAGEALSAITDGQGHGPYHAVVRDPPS